MMIPEFFLSQISGKKNDEEKGAVPCVGPEYKCRAQCALRDNATMWTRFQLCSLLILLWKDVGGGRADVDAALLPFTPTTAFPNR